MANAEAYEVHQHKAVEQVYAHAYKADRALAEAMGWARTANNVDLYNWLRDAKAKTAAVLGHLNE